MGIVIAETPLNGSLEMGLRVSAVLTAAFPHSLDVSRLVLLDHAVLHSGDLGGPASIHPDLPIKSGELGIKREWISRGLDFACRVGLAEGLPTAQGIEFRASEDAPGLLSLMTSQYYVALAERTNWAVDYFADLNDEALRAHMSEVFGHRSEEFDQADSDQSLGAP